MLNTALIGAGGFGYCHLLALEKLISQQKIALKAVCDVNPCFRQELEAKGIAFFTDYRELLSTVPNLDYITISTPIPTHSEIAAACLAYGAHVLLEKLGNSAGFTALLEPDCTSAIKVIIPDHPGWDK